MTRAKVKTRRDDKTALCPFRRQTNLDDGLNVDVLTEVNKSISGIAINPQKANSNFTRVAVQQGFNFKFGGVSIR